MIPNQNWYAPSLTSNREAGLGNWSIKDIKDLLQVGVSHRATVYGPMAEVVYNSLQYLSDEDVEAMAVYLKELPQRDSEPPPTSSARLVSPNVMELGRKIYAKQCFMCHGDEGKGFPPSYPPLAANQSITMSSPVNSIRMVLNGGYAPGTMKNPQAAWHAALLAHPQRRGSGGGGDLHPRRLGEQRHARDSGADQRTAHDHSGMTRGPRHGNP